MKFVTICTLLIVCLVCFALVEARTPRQCSPCPKIRGTPVCAQRCGQNARCTFPSACEARRQRCLNNEISIVVVLNSQASRIYHPCNVAPTCSDTKNLAWAMDELRCHVFYNPCLQLTEECSRQNRGEGLFTAVDKEKCQLHCDNICEESYEPVCAQFFNDFQRTFNNRCELYKFACVEEKPYSFIAPGLCAEIETMSFDMAVKDEIDEESVET
ncbi:uncharacterized protein LOC115620386 [Scaptodrosophila lebanonensis]|uniref:Uncharacterized protein LOC115620386 n=1 Tax=Drosophila lebanonensis TaxID=7225 RepID=A0A6J2T046_DROLE|nr:uncharacterized protein LOC115620386 [Scaptodrosophila lebanonensis]